LAFGWLKMVAAQPQINCRHSHCTQQFIKFSFFVQADQKTSYTYIRTL
jgi:hypothetical protein